MLPIKFRFADSSDYRYFANLILDEDYEVQKHLGLLGFDEDYFKCTDWRAVFVAEWKDLMGEMQKIGCISVSGGNSNGFNYIGLSYVNPDYRNQGYGKQLIDFALNYARNTWNAGGVDLYTIDNDGMDLLLKRMGFIKDGYDKKHYYLNGHFISQKRWIKLYENIPQT